MPVLFPSSPHGLSHQNVPTYWTEPSRRPPQCWGSASAQGSAWYRNPGPRSLEQDLGSKPRKSWLWDSGHHIPGLGTITGLYWLSLDLPPRDPCSPSSWLAFSRAGRPSASMLIGLSRGLGMHPREKLWMGWGKCCSVIRS